MKVGDKSLLYFGGLKMKKVNRGPRKRVDLSTVRRSSRVADKSPQAYKEVKKLIFQTSRHISHADVIGTENDSLDRSSATRIDNPLAESQHYGINRVLTSGDATTNRIHQQIIDIQNLSGIIGLTLWNEMATEFNMAEYELMQKPIVIVVSSC
ncbi:hypothetical protein Tco_1057037 [Tanacetum coccineum]|uniref:Uncharacterized protein n=1 Tax=Tanacetum coccineum TaxID=301880 RepID=A0ABQ5H5R2_9ASTR